MHADRQSCILRSYVRKRLKSATEAFFSPSPEPPENTQLFGRLADKGA